MSYLKKYLNDEKAEKRKKLGKKIGAILFLGGIGMLILPILYLIVHLGWKCYEHAPIETIYLLVFISLIIGGQYLIRRKWN